MSERPEVLYHFSEDPLITQFEPRSTPGSASSDELVWAVDRAHAYLYYFPRECPRVTFYASEQTSRKDRERFLGETDSERVVAIETAWLKRMQETVLFRYELPGKGFELRDANAGYWVSREAVTPVAAGPVGDLVGALMEDGAEVRMLPTLWPLYDAVVSSTLGFSIIRWRNATPRGQVR